MGGIGVGVGIGVPSRRHRRRRHRRVGIGVGIGVVASASASKTIEGPNAGFERDNSGMFCRTAGKPVPVGIEKLAIQNEHALTLNPHEATEVMLEHPHLLWESPSR